ncbi:hypothetical protein SAMN05443543_1079 [Flavobacterium flevense]|nr:hypothetical protein [Flavobacterium flevense]SHL91459.1 hypothetical protein SAMN05443543_1079 [Flavobacterium flevense]
MKNCFLLILCLWFNTIYCCDCPPHLRETMVSKGLKYSNIVFYGELIKIDTIERTYSFRIIELYKGNYKSSLIKGKFINSNCEIFPFKKDLWIVYANFNNDKTIKLDYCLPTQTIEIPPGFLPPIPLFTSSERKTTKIDSLSNEIDNLKIRNETMSNWFYQLEQLRAYKLSQNLSTENTIEDFNFKILITSLIINGILFLALIVLLLKNRKSKI